MEEQTIAVGYFIEPVAVTLGTGCKRVGTWIASKDGGVFVSDEDIVIYESDTGAEITIAPDVEDGGRVMPCKGKKKGKKK